MSSIFDRVDPDTLLENTGSGGYSIPVDDGFVDWNEKKGEYSSTDEFLNRNPETGTYDSESYQEEKEKYPTPELSDNPYAFPSVSGAAVSVEQSLSKISFVQGTSGQMSSAIAYIRYWSRKGTQQKTSVNYDPVNGSPADPQEALAGNFSAVQSLNVSGGSAVNTDVSGSFQITGENPVAGFVPTNTAYQSQIRQTTPAPATPATPSVLSRLGSIFSANPGGATAPAWANPFSSRAAAPSPDNAVWQFLFNPEELQLSSGPDFNRAETWGVSDPANSGQPLSWRSNKNRKLTFGKVLLHGYTFGRRVDSLEKGLQELFLARDGENGADGPPVLEFVWGQRVFGPCVIQNIQVREKAWDKGLLVNAEVSFDLEQVPEWTINDGFVDVLRPGRQSTVNDPTVASEEYRDTAGGDGKTPAKTAPTQTPINPQNDADFCSYALRQSQEFQTVLYRANNLYNEIFAWDPLFFEEGVPIIDPFGTLTPKLNKYKTKIMQLLNLFLTVKSKLYNTSVKLGEYVDKKVSSGCRNSQNSRSGFKSTVADILRTNSDKKEFRLLRWIIGCTKETKSAIDNWAKTEAPCKSSRLQSQTAKKKKDLVNKCKSLVQGEPCGNRLVTDSSCSGVNGYSVKCLNNKWVRIWRGDEG